MMQDIDAVGDLKVGLLVTMYDEVTQVTETLGRTEWDKVAVVRSTDDVRTDYFNMTLFDVDVEESFPNLSAEYDTAEVPARALCRNYSRLFQIAAEWEDSDYLVAITGDTILLHRFGVNSLIARMRASQAILACSKAIGQEFHAEGDKPNGGRMQENVLDFQPQFFVVNAKYVREWGLFTEIECTNRWCSEQCLGDAFGAAGGTIDSQLVFAEQAYNFQDGVLYNAEVPDGRG